VTHEANVVGKGHGFEIFSGSSDNHTMTIDTCILNPRARTVITEIYFDIFQVTAALMVVGTVTGSDNRVLRDEPTSTNVLFVWTTIDVRQEELANSCKKRKFSLGCVNIEDKPLTTVLASR
jgi:hypothetical protein